MKDILMIPVPYFILDQDFTIIETSKVTSRDFPIVSSFLDIIDEESQAKFTGLLTSQSASGEVNMTTIEGKAVLFDLYFNQVNNFIHIVAIKKSSEYLLVQSQMVQLREQMGMISVDTSESFLANFDKGVSTSIPNQEPKDYDAVNVQNRLQTIEEILRMVRPDFIENYKSDYIELLLEQVSELKRLIK